MSGTRLLIRTGADPLVLHVSEDVEAVRSQIQAAATANRGIVMAFAKLTQIATVDHPIPGQVYVRIEKILAIEEYSARSAPRVKEAT